MLQRITGALIVSAVLLTNLAFVVLGSTFDYPDVLTQPTRSVLARFAEQRAEVSFWFAVLAVSAGVLAPVSVLLGRIVAGRAMRVAVPVGVAAGVVQLVGLLRWPILVPGASVEEFDRIDLVLGVVVGETFGYALTATWTVLVVVALAPISARWFSVWGVMAAALILAGALAPLGVPVVDAANFVGYVLWSGWLLVLGVRLLRRRLVPAT